VVSSLDSLSQGDEKPRRSDAILSSDDLCWIETCITAHPFLVVDEASLLAAVVAAVVAAAVAAAAAAC
jgi:hypothetical protein